MVNKRGNLHGDVYSLHQFYITLPPVIMIPVTISALVSHEKSAFNYN